MTTTVTHFDGPNGAVVSHNFFTDRDLSAIDKALIVITANHEDNITDVETAGDNWTRISQETVEIGNLQANTVYATTSIFELNTPGIFSFAVNLSYAAVLDAQLLEIVND